MACLTLEQITRENKEIDPSSLHLSHRAFTDVSCLANFHSLERLDLSFNCLSSLEALSSCVNLKWLSVVENKLESLKGIQRLSKLTVFNAGKNKLTRIDEVSSVTSLRALILNDNNISSICKLDKLQYLNTLVLSKNPIYELGKSLMKMKSLTKLSLSHCYLEKIGSSLTSCVELKELRLAHNKITTISSELAGNTRLQNLDLGNNLIRSWSELKVLGAMPHLKNLNFQGNPIAEKEKFANKVKQLVPNLRIFNAKPVEAGNKSKRFSEEDAMRKIDPSASDVSDSDPDEALKKKLFKKDGKTFKRHVLKTSNEEVRLPSNDEVFSSLSNDEVGKRDKRKRSEKGMPKKSSPNQKMDDGSSVADARPAEKAKNKEFEHHEVPLFVDTKDLETLSAVPALNDSEHVGKKKNHVDEKQVPGLIIEHKKNKKAKIADPFTLPLLTPSSEVGLGGPSTWDD